MLRKCRPGIGCRSGQCSQEEDARLRCRRMIFPVSAVHSEREELVGEHGRIACHWPIVS